MGVSFSFESCMSLHSLGSRMWVHFYRGRIPVTESQCSDFTVAGKIDGNQQYIPIVWQIFQQDDDLFDCSENISQRTQSMLSKTLVHTPSVHCIIVTNLQEIVVFVRSQDDDSYAGTYERVRTTDFPLALRAVAAAYLDRELPARVFLNCPDIEYGVDMDLVFPEGPQQDPSPQALPTDETIFATCHQHSDFDIPTLVRDPRRALQFLRWCKHVQSRHSKIVAHSNDVLNAVTNEIGPRCVPSPCPLFSLELSELPKETMCHLKEIQRQCPLATAGLADLLSQSERFSLEIQSLLSEGNQNSLGTVYRCEITSIDDQPTNGCPPSASNFWMTASSHCLCLSQPWNLVSNGPMASSSNVLYLTREAQLKYCTIFFIRWHSLSLMPSSKVSYTRSYNLYREALFPGSMVHIRWDTYSRNDPSV